MIHTKSHIVTEIDSRGRQRGNQCFYCNGKIGEEHESNCVCRKRTVVLECKIQMVVECPESWDKSSIEFHRNGGSWCADNLVSEIGKRKDDHCLCPITEFRYVREATEDDEVAWDIDAARE